MVLYQTAQKQMQGGSCYWVLGCSEAKETACAMM